MNQERRRYFRIEESVGVGYRLLHPQTPEPSPSDEQVYNEARFTDILDLVVEHDSRIEQLLVELEDRHPQVVELITLFNQKLERVVTHLLLDSQLIKRIAHKVRAANISACGIAFECEESIEPETDLHLQLTLYPSEQQLETHGRVISCEAEGETGFYWRIDFFGMSKGDQEALIQHIVRAQSSQLKNKRR